MKDIDTNKELEGIASNRIGMMLKSLNKASPVVDEEIISLEEAQELFEKARKKLIDLKADELKALKNIAQQSLHYKFEDVSLMPNENKKLDKALDAYEIDLEQLKIDNSELYRDTVKAFVVTLLMTKNSIIFIESYYKGYKFFIADENLFQ